MCITVYSTISIKLVFVDYRFSLSYSIISLVQATDMVTAESAAWAYVVYTGRFFFRDDGCDGKTTLGVTAELHYEQRVDVYVGMPCSAGSHHFTSKSFTFYSV